MASVNAMGLFDTLKSQELSPYGHEMSFDGGFEPCL